MSAKRQRKRAIITRAVAVQRASEMVSQIAENVEIALAHKAVFQSASDIVMTKYDGRESYEAHCYHRIMHSQALNLALVLARLFDLGSKRLRTNKRSIASIPLMLHLLGQNRCRKAYVEQAREWTPHMPELGTTNAATCDDAIKSALEVYARLRKTKKGLKAVKTLKKFRDKRLAHNQLNLRVLKIMPLFGHLFLLTDVARDIAGHAKLAVFGDSLDLKEMEEEFRRQADAFWEPALKAVFTSTIGAHWEPTATEGTIDIALDEQFVRRPWSRRC